MSNAVKISVVIITFNEKRNIAQCINSIRSIADDILVIDSFSTDDTATIALNEGARVIQHKFEGHIQQKNFAISKAIYPHILSLDADEKLDDECLNQIIAIKKNWIHDGYTTNRLNNYCGRWIRYGAWYPDIKLRLWDSRKGKWGGTNPHDKFEMETGSSIVHIPGNLLHYSYQTIDEHIKKSKYFSSIAAQSYFDSGKKSSIIKIVLNPIYRFLRDYILKLGFCDGKYGFVIAKITANEVFLKYKKLYHLQNI